MVTGEASSFSDSASPQNGRGVPYAVGVASEYSVTSSQVPHVSTRSHAGRIPMAKLTKAAIHIFLFFIIVNQLSCKSTISCRDFKNVYEAFYQKVRVDFMLISNLGKFYIVVK